ncbi:MAG: hypothetical protein AAGI25_19490 [Bacteroidota bacterium]
MKTLLVLFFMLAMAIPHGRCQQDGISIGTPKPDPSAVLDVHSHTGTKGILIPRIPDKYNVVNPADGLMLIDSTDHNFYQYNGIIGSWQAVFPRGGIIMWSGDPNNVPDGWVLCDGNIYGGIETPDLSGKFIVAYDAASSSTPVNQTGLDTNYGQVNNTGGKDSVMLETAQLPPHSHGLTNDGKHRHTGLTLDNGSHYHGVKEGSGGNSTNSILGQNGNSPNFAGMDGAAEGYIKDSRLVQSDGDHHHSFTTDENGDNTLVVENTGLGDFHENRPAYYVLAFIMKL